MKEPRFSASDEAPTLTWRQQARKELIDRRLAATPSERARWSAAINSHLSAKWPKPPGDIIAFCWPFKAEHDVRAVVEQWMSIGARAALPVVVAPRTPLIFRRWHAGAKLERGALGIPYPADAEEMRPDTILLPANGFDAMGFRLGYGAGYFDRTIAGLRPDVRIIGISYEIGRMSSIGPQHHDEPMDFVVTEAGVHVCTASRAGVTPS
ncbi:MAG: 5-formyltetrahydrofolate cyclo-ligase [Caldimonas sp.]